MLNINNLFLFIFIFSLLGILRILSMFIVSLLQNPPKEMVISKRETILFGVFISYVITYLLN
jgi:hypothetical protein